MAQVFGVDCVRGVLLVSLWDTIGVAVIWSDGFGEFRGSRIQFRATWWQHQGADSEGCWPILSELFEYWVFAGNGKEEFFVFHGGTWWHLFRHGLPRIAVVQRACLTPGFISCLPQMFFLFKNISFQSHGPCIPRSVSGHPTTHGAKLFIAATSMRADRNRYPSTFIRCCEFWVLVEQCLDTITFKRTISMCWLRLLLASHVATLRKREHAGYKSLRSQFEKGWLVPGAREVGMSSRPRSQSLVLASCEE